MCFPVRVDSKLFSNKEKDRVEHENSEKITDDKTGTSGNVTQNFRYSGCHRIQTGCRNRFRWRKLGTEDSGSKEANDRVPDSESREKGKGFDLKDGKYTGSANGYGGKVTVTVTIKNKKIVKIHIDSAPGETTSFFNRAKTLTDLMIRQQSTDVDAVSGATYSSKGIIGAVKNALYGIKSTTKQAPASFGEKGKAKKVAKVTETGNCFLHVLLPGECFACGKCAERCPRRNAERPFPGKYLKSKQ